MINSTTYENMSINLENASAEVVYEVGAALVVLNKALIKDPDNIIRAKYIFQKTIQQISNKFKKESIKWIDDEISKSYIVGIQSANAEIKSIGRVLEATNEITNGSALIKSPPPIFPIPEIQGQVALGFENYSAHTDFFRVFRAAAYYSLEDKPLQIMRKADDIFRQIAVQVGEQSFKESDIITRRQLSQKLLDEYAKKGLQCVTYKDGRRVSIDSYCEMLGRTLTGRCALQASINRYVETGYDLGIVSAHFRACDFCTPYEGRILSLDGRDKRYESIWDAETQGLFHPACYSDDTEVYTSNGWKLFNDVNNQDKIFSLNPKNHIPEWVNFNKKFEYNPGNEMVKFKSNSFDLLVTKNHNMYVNNIFMNHCFIRDAYNLYNDFYNNVIDNNYAFMSYDFDSKNVYRCGILTNPRIIYNYDGLVYCLELEKNHIMLVRRNGKISWCGNCKHDISPYFEGITPELDISVDRAEQALIDEYGYKEAQIMAYSAQQQQRYIERQIRKYKRRESISLDEISKKKASNKIREWQLKQREHLKENSFLPRKYSREQIKKAH